MSSYLAAAAACDAASASRGADGEAAVGDEEVRLRHHSIRARLEESLADAAASLALRERQAMNIHRREVARELREGERAAAQQQRNEALMASIMAERSHALSHAGADGGSVTPNMSHNLPPLHDSDGVTESVCMTSIDVFRRLRIEEERRMAMAQPQEGIAGLYNTLRRPLSSDDAEGPDASSIVPTVAALIADEGAGARAGAKLAERSESYAARRAALAEVSAAVGALEDDEVRLEGRARLERDLQRYDALRRSPPPLPVRIAPYPSPTAVIGTPLPDGDEDAHAEHPVDAYHRLVRESMGHRL